MKSIDLLPWLQERAGRDVHAVRAELSALLGSTDRQLTLGWWHADDTEQAIEMARDSLQAHGFELDEVAFRAHASTLPGDLEEDDNRRHQLGFIAWSLNRAWAAQKSDRRARCLGWDLAWERDEPPWVWLTAQEEPAVRALGGSAPALEATYEGDGPLPVPVRPALDLDRLAPHEAHRRADEAFRAGRYADALVFLPRAKADGSHGLLAELRHVEVLRRLGRDPDARLLVGEIARDWLSGRRQVWDTQWQALHTHASELELSADTLAALAARAGR